MRWLVLALMAVGMVATPAVAATPKAEVAVASSVTRGEFAQAVARWIDFYEDTYKRSLKSPKESVLLYVDLGGSLKETVNQLESQYRLFEGVDDFAYGVFEPSKPLTRLQAAQILRNLVTLVEADEAARVTLSVPREFRDRSSDQATAAAIDLLTTRRIFFGYPDKTFMAEEKLTRRQFEALRSNVMGYLETASKKP
ncbi:MAG TPA: S-layer homology domain-containing protein [Stenomitos sp.]